MTAREPQQLPKTRGPHPTVPVLVKHSLHSLLLDGTYHTECNCELMRNVPYTPPTSSAVPDVEKILKYFVHYIILPNQLGTRMQDISGVREGISGEHDELNMDISTKQSFRLRVHSPNWQSSIKATSHVCNPLSRKCTTENDQTSHLSATNPNSNHCLPH